jgi:hypothetical protein
MEEIKFTPYLKENIYRQIRERVKKTIPFQGGHIGTVIGSMDINSTKVKEAKERELMKQEDLLSKQNEKLSKQNERNLEIENKIMAKARKHSEKLRLKKEA